MNRVALLLVMLIVSIGADEMGISAVSKETKEGKSLYVPLVSPIDFQKEREIQERDQNMTRQSSQE